MFEVAVGAGINPVLNIEGKRGNLHLLDTVIMPVPLFDVVGVEPRNDGKITLKYAGREGIFPEDRALRCAVALCEKYGLPGMNVKIEKNIPVGAGLGGSAADAAGIIIAARSLFGIGEIDEETLLGFGSDVPAACYGKPCRVRGTGERITPLDLPPLDVFLVIPPSGVSTKECYDLYDEIGGDRADAEEYIGTVRAGGEPRFGNSLLRAAERLNPDVAKGLAVLRKCGFSSGMTGSGSGLFGINRFGGAGLRELAGMLKNYGIITF